jgi:hypothetical protein
MAITNKQVRQARSFLQQRRITTSMISPRDFARSSEELGKDFKETLEFLKEMLARRDRGRITNEMVTED